VINDRGKSKPSENILLCATFYTTNLIRTILEIDPDLRGERPATNLKAGLNYDIK
jgi:hypothetical protein